MKLGIVGLGQFSRAFVPLWKAHPLISQVRVTDLVSERRDAARRDFGVTTVATYDELLDWSDAIAVFAQRHLHGPLVLAALRAGKHVYSAVPVADSIEEIAEIVALVEKTRLIYMLGETAYYYPGAIFCRREFARGSFGDFVYAESNYYHDMSHGFYEAFQYSGGDQWQRVAGYPPMHYPTHTLAPIVSATGASVTRVSCFGFEDRHSDGIFTREGNDWHNPFSNETALFQLSNGGMARVNEFRRVALKKGPTYLGSFLGTRGSYERAADRHVFARMEPDGTMMGEDVSALLNSAEMEAHRGDPDFFHRAIVDAAYESKTMSPVMSRARLPRTFEGIPSGHRGAHKFLVDDFAKAVTRNQLPPNHAWAAARYNIPGLVAHQSAMRGGELLDVPDLGDPPSNWDMLDPDRPA